MISVLILGGGGREHALAWKAAQSEQVAAVFCAPGNAGTATEPKVNNVAIASDDIPRLVDFAREHAVELAIVGPEAPLVAGVVDEFTAAGLKCFGPTQAAAILEASKAYSKDFLVRHGIPTARYQRFKQVAAARAYIKAQPLPVVVKADGLAAGKGVVIAQTHEQALSAAETMLSGAAFGAAGREIVVEEFLTGEEASFIVMTDGEHVIPFASSQDHKARDDGDQGPNTGGMGAYSPAPVIDQALHGRIMRDIIHPTLRGMAAEGRPYRGFLYAGLMISSSGQARVLEYNCRLGDPEAQAILWRLRADLVGTCIAVLNGRATEVELDFNPHVALGVVLAAGGYPAEYSTGELISGLTSPPPPSGTKVFHAGTALRDGGFVTAGGRVLCVVASGRRVADAQRAAYDHVAQISWPGGVHYRHDIGYRAVRREIG